MNTANLRLLDKAYIWHPFTQMSEWEIEDHPIIVRGEGNVLIDSDGYRYLDGISSLWTIVHGHNHPKIVHAVRSQAEKLMHSTLLGLSNEPSIMLAEKLVAVLPPGFTKVFYSDNGSTSVEIALKMAFQYWQQQSNFEDRKKTKIVSFVNAYHGDTIGAVSVGGMDLFHKLYQPLLFDTLKAAYPDCIRCRWRAQCENQCWNELELLFAEKGKTIAALIIEPLMQGAAGMLHSSILFLRKVRELCTHYRVLMIVDEVATGFGRTGAMFACEKAHVVPDLMCLAKGLSGGVLPIAATVTTTAVFDAFLGKEDELKAFFHGHTFTGNPLACAAAIANLDIFLDEQTVTHFQVTIQYLTDKLVGFMELAHVGDIRQEGGMVGIELFEDVALLRPYPRSLKIGHQVVLRARTYGVMLRPLGNVIVLMPPLSITLNELDLLLDATYRAIDDVTNI